MEPIIHGHSSPDLMLVVRISSNNSAAFQRDLSGIDCIFIAQYQEIALTLHQMVWLSQLVAKRRSRRDDPMEGIDCPRRFAFQCGYHPHTRTLLFHTVGVGTQTNSIFQGFY